MAETLLSEMGSVQSEDEGQSMSEFLQRANMEIQEIVNKCRVGRREEHIQERAVEIEEQNGENKDSDMGEKRQTKVRKWRSVSEKRRQQVEKSANGMMKS